MAKSYPPVIVVDEDDHIIGDAMLADAWTKGLRHRIAFVVVENAEGKLLLHKRAPTMRLYAGCWDVPGGHVDAHPDYRKTAKQELAEEVGITGVPLKEVGYTYCDTPYSDGTPAKRFIKVYLVRYDGEPGALAEDEATEARWFTRAELARLRAEHPELVADGLLRALPYILHTEKAGKHA